jgi:hypothetical protein
MVKENKSNYYYALMAIVSIVTIVGVVMIVDYTKMIAIP